MIVYRICDKKHADDLSGAGAATFGGRWNKKGIPVLYTGESKEIALLETIVNTPPMIVPKLDVLTLEIPDDSIFEIGIEDLPSNWINYPAPSILSEIADLWVSSQTSIALKVPSCVIPSAHNYILNYHHPDYQRVRVLEQKDFHFDSRLTT